MWHIHLNRFFSTLPFILFLVLLAGYSPAFGDTPQHLSRAALPAPGQFLVSLWTNGQVYYEFKNDVPSLKLSDSDKKLVRDAMKDWRTALSISDPASGINKPYITFSECPVHCTPSYRNFLLIRYDRQDEVPGNMCHYKVNGAGPDVVGMNPDGATVLHLNRGQDSNTILHELGHCLGLWHEHDRTDNLAWLRETSAWQNETEPNSLMPLLGNYDYNSIMHYASFTASLGTTGTLLFRDNAGNAFSRWRLEALPNPADRITARLRSRVLQYYARQVEPKWGFFESLSPPPANNRTLPNPYLVSKISAVGTPAIAFQGGDNFDVLVRGSDRNLYWGQLRNGSKVVANWLTIGCCFGSDPAVISRGVGQLDVVAVGADTGKLLYNHYANHAWGTWQYVRGGYPTGRIKTDPSGGYLGPALSSRSATSLDAFVVRTDGLLALTTFSGESWSAWRTLGSDYSVTARPAAVALTATMTRLAINSENNNLYEPRLTFPVGTNSFTLGTLTARTAWRAAPALTRRDDATNPYRVLIVTADGRVAHRFASGQWRDIGGIPKRGTGVSAVATGPSSALIVMNGEDAVACTLTCLANAPNPGMFIQPGGLWLRIFQ